MVLERKLQRMPADGHDFLLSVLLHPLHSMNWADPNWVAGRLGDEAGEWELLGIYTHREAAVQRCEGTHDFISPIGATGGLMPDMIIFPIEDELQPETNFDGLTRYCPDDRNDPGIPKG